MASWMVHLRIADKLLGRISDLDESAFVLGNIAPDSGVPNEDWYDLDFRYLAEHPDFRAFHLYEDAADIRNVFMQEFAEDAFENRREYICGYYRSDNHGDLYRDYRYLTKERSDRFVEETTDLIMEILREENRCR